MWRNVKTNRATTFFLTFLFIMLPFLIVPAAIDPDLNPRLIAVSVVCVIMLIPFLNRSAFLPFSFRNTARSALAIQAFSIIAVFMAINTGEAIAEWLRIFIVYAFLLVCVLFFYKNKPDVFMIVRYISLAVLIFSGFAIFQTIPLVEAVFAGKKFTISSDLASTLSNKNFFSEVLVLLIPAVFYAILNDERKYKLLHIPAFVLAVLFVLLLTSLACWVALIVSISVTALIAISKRASGKKATKRNPLTAFAISSVALIVIGIFIFKNGPVGRSLKFKAEMISRYISDPSLLDKNVYSNNNSVFDRLLMIRNSLRMFADHPVLGAGMNNWKLFYPSYGVGGTEVINSGSMNFEHPHNDYLLILTEQGIFGLVLYVFFFVCVLQFWLRKWKKGTEEERSFLFVILFAIVAFLTISLFSYPRSRIYSPVLLMFYISLMFSEGNNEEKNIRLKPLWVIFICSICLITVVVTGIRLNSEIHAKEMIRAKYQNNFARVMRESDKINHYFFPIEYSSTSIEWYRGMALFYSGQIPAALNEYKKAIERTPYHLRTLNDLATAYEQSGLPDSAIAFYRKALEMSPNLNDSKFNLTATYFNLNKTDSAYSVLNMIPYHELGLGPQENYVKFMSVVLAAKIYDSLKTSKDTLFIKKMNLFINDIPRTKQYIRAYKGKTIWPDVFTDIK